MSLLPPALAAYRLVTGLLEPLAPRLLANRAQRGKEDPLRIGERLGRASLERPQGALVWLHGVSVGESLSILPLAQALKARRPDLAVLVTSGTPTSAALLARRLPEGAIHQFAPLDAPRALDRFLDHWRPDAIVLVESEVWPNLIAEASRRGATLALLSARLSEKSLRNWARTRVSAARLFGAFDLVMAQDEETAAGLARLGGRDDGRLNLKLAGEPLPVEDEALDRAKRAAGTRPLLLAASTHAGEEALVLDAFAGLAAHDERPLLVIVPRHPARGLDVAQLARQRGFATTLQSAGEPFDGQAQVHVADGLGELGLWFRLARAAFVGGSLVEGPGGHNPLEPARLGAPILTGPWVRNWRSVFAALGDSVTTVEDAASLARALTEALDDPAAARARAAAARTRADVGGAQLELAVTRLLERLP
jgi:3-deoxy-D-manno-octulosonic-acid transferase